MLWALRRFFAEHVPQLRALPSQIRRFYLRAWLGAVRRAESAVFLAPASPAQVAVILELGRDSRRVVELGTGGAMTAIALALADPRRVVITYDTTSWPFREHCLELAPREVRSRIELRQAAGEEGPRPGDPPPELLFIDSSHAEAETVASFEAWRPSLALGASVVFHDYENAEFPGVAAAVRRLGLSGTARRGMFIWTAPGSAA